MRFFYANITTLGDEVDSLLIARDKEVVLACDAHRIRHPVPLMARRTAQVRRELHVGLASPSDRSPTGTTGGCAAWVQRHLYRSPSAASERHGGAWVTDHSGFVSLGLSLGRLPLVVACGYCRDGPDDQVFHVLARATRNGSISFAFALDGNCEAEDLLLNPALVVLGAHVVALPPDARTCWASEEGSVIDHLLVPEDLLPLVTHGLGRSPVVAPCGLCPHHTGGSEVF